MGAPSKKDTGKYVVARGRTVKIDGRSFGPGKPVDLSPEDLEHLRAAGFVTEAEAEPGIPSPGVRVGGLQIKGGRRRAGSIV